MWWSVIIKPFFYSDLFGFHWVLGNWKNTSFLSFCFSVICRLLCSLQSLSVGFFFFLQLFSCLRCRHSSPAADWLTPGFYQLDMSLFGHFHLALFSWIICGLAVHPFVTFPDSFPSTFHFCRFAFGFSPTQPRRLGVQRFHFYFSSNIIRLLRRYSCLFAQLSQVTADVSRVHKSVGFSWKSEKFSYNS